MSSRRASVSSVLDRLESWSEPVAVNPRKRNEARTATREEPLGPARFALLTAAAFAVLAMILLAWFLNTAGIAGFIYAQF